MAKKLWKEIRTGERFYWNGNWFIKLQKYPRINFNAVALTGPHAGKFHLMPDTSQNYPLDEVYESRPVLRKGILRGAK